MITTIFEHAKSIKTPKLSIIPVIFKAFDNTFKALLIRQEASIKNIAIVY